MDAAEDPRQDPGEATLASVRQRFANLRHLAEAAMAQVQDGDLGRAPAPDLNPIEVVARHQAGNLRSRFTDFLTSDGEKPWRQRDGEFEAGARSREAILADWADGWGVLEATLAALVPADLGRTVTIRGAPHTVIDALLRQLAHHGYHVGQIVLTARWLAGARWTSLSIPRGASDAYRAGEAPGDVAAR